MINSIKETKQFDLYRSESSHNSTVNWNSIKEFLSNDEVAIAQFITSLKTTTKQSLLALEQSIIAKDYEKTSKISHRMNPIFKQINALDIAEIIHSFETNPEKVTVYEYKKLEDVIVQLFDNINLDDTI